MPDLPDDSQAQELLDAYLRDLQAGRTPDRGAIIAKRPDLESALNCLELLDRMAPAADPDSAPTLAGSALAEGGERVGKYEIVRELGRGGMGVVYLARDTELNRSVALKMILAGSMAGEEYLRRFQAEVRASAQLDHEGIVRVYDSGEFNGLPFLAMQYVEGLSLAELLKHRRPDADWSVRCAIKLARTVAYLHAHGIVHRDLKPANILLNAECGNRNAELDSGGTSIPHSEFRIPNLKITDFGLVKLLEEDSHATRSGVIVGTPSYMAPEQARGESRSVGPAADVYALGAILYELLTGRPPFAGDTALSTLMQVMGSEPVSPRRLDPAVHHDLEAICLKCLEKSPERRFASAGELADALERHLKGEDVPAARPTPRQAVERWMRRNPALASRLAILLACLLVLLTNTAVRGSIHYSKTYAELHLGHLCLIFAAWLGLSWFFQRLVRRQIALDVVPYIWTAADVGILTVTLLLTDSFASPIDIGYPLLIAASGLWLRERLVAFTTGCCVLAYGGATLLEVSIGKHDQVHRHVMFIAGLLTMTYLVVHQVRRFTALSRYYEGK